MRLLSVAFALTLATAAVAGCLGSEPDAADDPAAQANVSPSPANATNETEPADPPEPRGNETPGDTPPEEDEGRRVPVGYAYACPPGADEERDGGPCVRSIGDATSVLVEPYLAIHPSDSSLVALGANHVDPRKGPPGPAEGPGFDTFDMSLFVSEDGGETWQRRPLPYVAEAESGPADVGYKGDPTLAWTGEETLHVAGYVSHDFTVGDLEIFAATSPDAGETWETTTVLSSPGSSDRPWISRAPNGTLYGTWTKTFGARAPLASKPPGSAWELPSDASTVQPCAGASPVAFADRTPVVACAENDSVSVHAYAPGEGVAERGHVDLDDARYPLLTRAPNGSLVLAGSTDAATGSVPLWLSHDGGRTWTDAVDAAGLAGLDGEDVEATWVSTDPWGSVHVLLRAFPAGASVPVQGDRIGRPAVVHAALSPDLSEVLASQRLDPPEGLEEGRPESVETDTGDHYFGIAFGPKGGYLAWTEDRSLRLTTVEPVFEANATD